MIHNSEKPCGCREQTQESARSIDHPAVHLVVSATPVHRGLSFIVIMVKEADYDVPSEGILNKAILESKRLAYAESSCNGIRTISIHVPWDTRISIADLLASPKKATGLYKPWGQGGIVEFPQGCKTTVDCSGACRSLDDCNKATSVCADKCDPVCGYVFGCAEC
jgi:hypothetical protein